MATSKNGMAVKAVLMEAAETMKGIQKQDSNIVFMVSNAKSKSKKVAEYEQILVGAFEYGKGKFKTTAFITYDVYSDVPRIWLERELDYTDEGFVTASGDFKVKIVLPNQQKAATPKAKATPNPKTQAALKVAAEKHKAQKAAAAEKVEVKA